MPHTEAQAEQVLIGEDVFNMWLRNKLNTVKADKYRHKKNAPPGPLSGLIEMYETFESIKACLHQEGYLHTGNNTLYARDPSLAELTQCTATHLHMWYESDFSAYTADEKQWALEDLPGDLEDLAEVIAMHTGVQLWFSAAWRPTENEIMYASATTSWSHKWLEHEHYKDAIAGFIRFQLDKNPYSLSPYASQAGPEAYGAFNSSYKPWLPVMPPDMRLRKQLLSYYVALLHTWQGIKRAFKWESDTLENEEDQHVAKASRLPECLPLLTHLDAWSDEQTKALWVHVLTGQAGLLHHSEIFQLSASDDPDVDDVLCEDMAEDARLYYGPQSRIYVACVLARWPGDVQALKEVICSVPELVTNTSPFVPFDQNLIQCMFEDCCKQYTDLEQLVMDTISYEHVFPVQVTCGHWKCLFEACQSFPPDPPLLQGDIAYLSGNWWMPEAFFNVDSQKGKHLQYQVFSTMLHSGILNHQLSQMLLGGLLEEGKQPPYQAKYCPDVLGTQNHIKHYIDHLTQQIKQSIIQLCELRQNTQHVIPLPVPPTSVILQCWHVQGASLSRSPSLNQILKPAIKKPGKGKQKMKVKVVMTKGKSAPKGAVSATMADASDMDLDAIDESWAGPSSSATCANK
ncbi:hypothetical protein FRC06_007681 [Ceratobasidium sp. 370]|nr:hypothetical protein FRC06_007681 [Ceratobasidium sp. 370]